MIIGLPTYSVSAASKGPLINFITDALRASGCTILHVSSANIAPVVISFQEPDGRRSGIIAYAFLATRTPTKNRPVDERSFQLKYGSKMKFGTENLHQLYQDPMGLFTTMLIGIDLDEGFIVSVDPEMHNPTKLFIRMEFKDGHAEAIRRNGWHVWERAKRQRGQESWPTEVLIGATREHFLDLAGC